MKTLVLAAALCGLATPALAQDWYVKAGGVSAHNADFAPTLGGGYDFGNIRFDVSAARYDLDAPPVPVVSFLDRVDDYSATVYAEATVGTFSVFVGAGADYLLSHRTSNAFPGLAEFDANTTAWHWAGGVSVPVSRHWSIQSEYRFTESNDEHEAPSFQSLSVSGRFSF